MKRILTLQKMMMEGEMVPRGYGIAYWDSMMGYTAIAYPVPLNLIVRAGRWIWYWLKVPRWGGKLLLTKPAANMVADVLDGADRQGPDTDFPEGVRYITISDTLASKLANQLRGATEVGDGRSN